MGSNPSTDKKKKKKKKRRVRHKLGKKYANQLAKNDLHSK
jgi:hypothetical protein